MWLTLRTASCLTTNLGPGIGYAGQSDDYSIQDSATPIGMAPTIHEIANARAEDLGVHACVPICAFWELLANQRIRRQPERPEQARCSLSKTKAHVLLSGSPNTCHFFFVPPSVFAASAKMLVRTSLVSWRTQLGKEPTFCLLFAHDRCLLLFCPLELGPRLCVLLFLQRKDSQRLLLREAEYRRLQVYLGTGESAEEFEWKAGLRKMAIGPS